MDNIGSSQTQPAQKNNATPEETVQELSSKETKETPPRRSQKAVIESAPTSRAAMRMGGAAAPLVAIVAVILLFGGLLVYFGGRGSSTVGTTTAGEDDEDEVENATPPPQIFTLPTKKPVLPSTTTEPGPVEPREIPPNALVLLIKEYEDFDDANFTFTLPTIPTNGIQLREGGIQVLFAPTEIGTGIKIVWDWDDEESPVMNVSLSPSSLSHVYTTGAPKKLVLWSEGGSQYFDGWSFFANAFQTFSGGGREDPSEANLPNVSAHFVHDIIQLGSSVRFASGAFAFCRNLLHGEDDMNSLVSQTPLLVEEKNFTLAVGGDNGVTTFVNATLLANEAALFFAYSNFNKPISEWFSDPTVTNMMGMFAGNAPFNQEISGWNVSEVTNMRRMFWNAAAFNQPLIGWNVSSVTDMSTMFPGAASCRFGLAPGDTIPSPFLLFAPGITLQNTINLSIMFGDDVSEEPVAFGKGLFAAILTYLSERLPTDVSKNISAKLNSQVPFPGYATIHGTLTTRDPGAWTISPDP
jgi:surface protein